MKKIILLLSLSMTLSQVSYGQLTITMSDFESLIGKSKTRTSFKTEDQTVVTTMIAKKGSGQTWDLTGAAFTNNGSVTEEILAGTNGVLGAEDPAFASATHHMKIPSESSSSGMLNAFFTLSTDGLNSLGTSEDSNGKTIKYYFTPALKQLQFPLSLGVKWSSTTSASSSSEPGQSVPFTHNYEVDAEGTLILPGGQSKTVLRIRDEQVISFGIFNDTTVIYFFQAKNDRESASIIAPKVIPIIGTQIPGSMTYFVGGGSGSVKNEKNDLFTVLPNIPNPFVSETEVRFSLNENENVSILLYDLLGNQISTIANSYYPKGIHSLKVKVDNLPAGKYYYTITAAGYSITESLIVSK